MLASVENSLLGQLPLSTVFHQVMESGRAGSAEVLTSRASGTAMRCLAQVTGRLQACLGPHCSFNTVEVIGSI